MSEFEKRYQEIVDTMEKAAARKGNEVHDTKKNAKAQERRENAAATEANRTLEEAEAQEIEKRSMKCSSTAANQWCVPAQSEHRRQDGWTSTPCGCDGIRKDSAYDMMAGERKTKHEEGAQEVERRSMTSSSTNTRRWGTDVKTIGRFHHAFCGRSGCSGGCDLLAGERLPKQRPQSDDHLERNSEEHLGAQVPHQDEEAGSIVFHSSSNANKFKNVNKEARVNGICSSKSE